MKPLRILTATCGLLSVSVFACAFFLFGFLRPDFDVCRDLISKLGARDRPYALCWNIFGFGAVGGLMASFGWLFGLCKNDRVFGSCLTVAGMGFAFAAIPTDFADEQSPFSRAHFVSICLSLAGYCLGLARLTGSQSPAHERIVAQWVIALAILPVFCVSGGVSAEPVAHRMILIIVFAWIVLKSLELLRLNANAESYEMTPVD